MTTILAIETSCDETAAAVVDDGRFIRSNVVFSQEELHRQFGGVVPELASRQHLVGIMPAVEKALDEAGAAWSELSAIAVSYGPGLAGSLLVGVNAAKAMAIARDMPLVGVNHLEGHIYANWLVKPPRWQPSEPGGARREPAEPRFPLLCLVVSGGHTELVLMRDHGIFELLGRTRDDAAGEAFDKVARILGLGYPGGPAIQRATDTLALTQGFIPRAYHLTRPWLRGSDDFSFSGLKTAMLRLVEGGSSGPVGNPSRLSVIAAAATGGAGAAAGDAERRGARRPVPVHIAQMAAAFQDAVVDVLVGKTIQAASDHAVRQIALAGGVAANRRLREQMLTRATVPVLIPDVDLCTDNAAMVAAAGYFRLRAGDTAGWDLDVFPNLRLA